MALPTTLETLRTTRHGEHVLVVELHRPDVSNALNTTMGRELLAVFGALALDAEGLRCIVLTGTGARAFCGGADLKERNGMTDDAWVRQHTLFEHAFAAIMDCPVPVIAAVNGAAYGGGCEFALACDFVYAASGARFALPEVTRGIIPGGGGTQNLPRAVGVRRARELIMTGTPFTADEALAWGMVNRICAPERLLDEALATAATIAANGPIAVRQAKRAIGLGSSTDLKTGLAIEIEAYNRTVPTDDRREGVAAFNEKRPPAFRGR
jgi:enoyl-CoA hydratase/carnithine racemase